jgi:hypothetical protein
VREASSACFSELIRFKCSHNNRAAKPNNDTPTIIPIILLNHLASAEARSARYGLLGTRYVYTGSLRSLC